ncbi:MAG: T9SS type A sorting domain-containing protein [Bacteroidia bacterium]|nr:T9SS type A sorting domain-containing protein [Bacteroidia bacterium]
MNKIIQASFFLLLLNLCASLPAQMIDNDIAPDWVLPDINGQSHHLYDYLDQNKPVVLYFFDASVPPCWNYHNTQALQDLYTEYGPGAKDSVRVFYIETNPLTTEDNLHGIVGTGQPASITPGDWTANNPCPVINLESDTLLSQYELQGDYPTLITVCPARVVKIAGQRTAAQHYELLTECPGVATDSIDAFAMQYVGPYYICWGHLNHPTLRIQNRGLKPLVAGTTEVVYVSTQQVVWSEPWTGNLKTYETEDIVLPRFNFTSAELTRFSFSPAPTLSVDATPLNNQAYWGISLFPNFALYDTLLNLELVTDQYGEEVTWELIADNNQVVQSGGPYPNLANPGTATYNIPMSLTKGLCYRFIIHDKFGDGVCCDYGNGFFRLKDSWGNTVVEGDTMYLEATGYVSTGYGTDTDEGISLKDPLELYPSPATDVLYMEIPDFIGLSNARAEIRNVMGQAVKEFEVTERKNSISVQDFAPGIYFLRLYFENGTIVAPFFKEKY